MSALAGPVAPRAVDLSGLNAQQRKAVCHGNGPLLVIAGAGSGKTRVLTTRIAHLVTARGVDPSSVLAITFTNKAAREMKERLEKMLGSATLGRMRVATFHSAFLRVLRRYPEVVGLHEGFTIFDTDDCTKLIENVTEDVGYDPKTVKPRGTLGAISAAKNALVSPAALSRSAKGRIAHAHAHIYGAYQLALQRNNAVDFDDILVHTVTLFTTQVDVLNLYQDRWQHILVDEYQDTNIAQNKIVRLLGAAHRNVTVVGDPDQCLLPDTPVATPAGPVRISALASGSQVVGTGGAGPLIGTVASVHKGHYSGPVVSVTAGDRKIVGTPHHIIPARFRAQQGTRIIYLMYRADRGYRIGRTSGIRASGDRRSGPQFVPGYIVRLNQEHGDRLWVLHSCTSEEESVYWESYYAAQYGIPKDCFHANGRGGMALSGMTLARLFSSIDTTTRAKQLMEDLHIHPDFPHHMSMGGENRGTLTFGMFCGNAPLRSGVRYHRIWWSTGIDNDPVAKRLADLGLTVRPNSSTRVGSRIEMVFTDYEKALGAVRAAEGCGVPIRRVMYVNGQKYPFTPLSHLWPGMSVLVEDDGQFVETPVESKQVSEYSGSVYDLEVEGLHSYVAGGVLVHNSIYRFRGAEIANILAFPRVFPEATTIALEQNYRSTATILDAANEVIQNNPGRPEKNLWTNTAGGARIVVHTAPNGFAEASWIAEEIGELRARGVRGPDIAVLCRGKMTGRGVEEALLGAGIPCVFSGAVPFFERTHIKDLLAYLRLVVNPADELAFRRIVNTPRRSVGPASIRKLRTWARYRDLDIDEAMERCDEVDELPAKAKEGLLKLREVLETARAQSAGGVGPDEVLADIIDATGYLAHVAQSAKGSTESALEAVERLLAIAGGHPSVLSLLEIAGLASQWEQDAEPDATDERVIIMTIHGAKGLEWPVVFVPAMEEGVFPDARCTSGPELEEERRLAYVAITRAQQRLYLSHAQSRMRFGYNERNEPSRFLGEIPEHLVSVSHR